MTTDDEYVQKAHIWYWKLASFRAKFDSIAEEVGADLTFDQDFAVVALLYRDRNSKKKEG